MKVYLVIEDIAIGISDIIKHKVYKYKLDALNHLRLFKERLEVRKFKDECIYYDDKAEIIEYDKYEIYHEDSYCDSHYCCYIKELELEE